MTNLTPSGNPEIAKAFEIHEAQQRITNTKVGCALVVTLMPAGSSLDYFVYRGEVVPFLVLRLICASIAALIWASLYYEIGRRKCKWLGVVVPLLPVIFIGAMIAMKDGFASPYYAGLNLVLLAVGAVLHWSLLESIVAVILVLFIYIGAGIIHGHFPESKTLFNNFYFISLMDIIVVVGTFFQNRARFREFALRYELDRNKRELETALTQLKEAEAELVQNEKLASLGRLGAGLIHEINNPLNYATTGLYTLKQKAKFLPAERQPDYNETIKDIEDGIQRVSRIVSDLRSFAHHDNESTEQMSAADLIASSLRFLSHDLREADVSVETKLLPEQKVDGNKNKLIQVCINLLQNSLDAIKEKKFTNDEPRLIVIEGRAENGTSALVFRDNGNGIKPENLDKIFDPFFTTKDVGEGMGLGLSICHRIIAECGGQIKVRSEPGKFCEFALEFPAKG